jgi:glycerol uptake facilitator-like aquaporin
MLLAIVVGSGIMGQDLSGGNVALALLANAIATGCGLVVLITVFGPWSGAHFNPAVSVVEWVGGRLPVGTLAAYLVAQVGGGIAGVWLAHAMFDRAVFELGTQVRASPGLWLAEVVATAGLVLVLRAASRRNAAHIPALVGLYITSAYWFTASTSFANPAVTLARAFTTTFAGIRPWDVPAFVLAQAVGAAVGVLLATWLEPTEKS